MQGFFSLIWLWAEINFDFCSSFTKNPSNLSIHGNWNKIGSKLATELTKMAYERMDIAIFLGQAFSSI